MSDEIRKYLSQTNCQRWYAVLHHQRPKSYGFEFYEYSSDARLMFRKRVSCKITVS